MIYSIILIGFLYFGTLIAEQYEKLMNVIGCNCLEQMFSPLSLDTIEIDISTVIESITQLLCNGSDIHKLIVNDLSSTISSEINRANIRVHDLVAVDYPFFDAIAYLSMQPDERPTLRVDADMESNVYKEQSELSIILCLFHWNY